MAELQLTCPIRYVTPDLLATLHQTCFVDAPWSADAFQKLLDNQACDGLLLPSKWSAVPAGFIIWHQVLDEIEILTLGIVPEERGLGQAQRMMQHAFKQWQATKAQKVFLEVAANNEAARKLYLRSGFQQEGLRKDYYKTPDGRVDACLYVAQIKQESP